MTNTVYYYNQITSSSYVLFMSPGDALFVQSGVLVASNAASGEAIAGNSGTTVHIDGELYGSTGIDSIGGTLYVGKTGSIVATNNAVTLIGSININNYGTIIGSQGAIYFSVASASNIYNIYNAGVIDGGTSYSFSDPDGSARITNVGVMKGDVVLPANGNVFDSTLGQVFGTIDAGDGGDNIIAGTNGGSVVGGAGNDVLYANTTQTAANNASQFVLDGKTGNNWLYGDGAFTTFDSGDNSVGTYNHIIGGQSGMANVAGYTNNTVSYAGLANDSAKSVYVDLINGAAYKSTVANASGAAQGTLIFEDYIQNIPNVIGSAGSDVIIADNGVDQITGGAGGDTLYAGTGSSSRDTFIYKALIDSPLANYDHISGFKVGTDKIDLSALNLPTAHLVLSYSGSGSNTVYFEMNPARGFNASTDMILSVKASSDVALSANDIIGSGVYQQYTISYAANGNVTYHYAGGTFFNGKPFQSFDNITNASGTLLSQTLYDSTGFGYQQTQFNANGSIYLQDSVSKPASGQLLYHYAGGSFFTGKSFSAFDNLAAAPGGTLLDQTLYNNDGSHTFTVPGSGLTLTAVKNDTFNVSGSNDTARFNTTGFAADTFNGYKAGDIFSFSTSIFANFQALQQHVSGTSSAIITTSANDTLTLSNVAANSLTSSMFKFA